MTGIVRRLNLLTALALLLSGVLPPLAAAQGVTCPRTYGGVEDARLAAGPAAAHEAPRAIPAPHPHDSIPQPDATGAPSASCGAAAMTSEQPLPSPVHAAHRLLHRGEPAPASLLIQSLFRPPRLS